jgi:hypothetical protein
MAQQLAAMLGTLAIQDASADCHPPAIYINACNYTRLAPAFLVWGKLRLQGPQ